MCQEIVFFLSMGISDGTRDGTTLGTWPPYSYFYFPYLKVLYIQLSINQSSMNSRRTANKRSYRRKETARLNRELSLEVGIYTRSNTPAAQSGTYARRAPAAEINCRIPSLATDLHAHDLLRPNDSIVSRHESNHWIMFSYFSVPGSAFWEFVLLPTEIRNFPNLYCEWYFSNTN